MDIGPGDFVECVDDSDLPEPFVCVGGVYQVGEVQARGRCATTGCVGLQLILPKEKVGLCSARFRPIYRPKSTLIETLKAPAPELEGV